MNVFLGLSPIFKDRFKGHARPPGTRYASLPDHTNRMDARHTPEACLEGIPWGASLQDLIVWDKSNIDPLTVWPTDCEMGCH